jgi:hypothetical protein
MYRPLLATALTASALAASIVAAHPSDAATLYTSCHGLAAGIAGLNVSDANPGRTPCKTELAAIPHKVVPLVLGTLDVATIAGQTRADQTPGLEQAAGSIAAAHLALLGLDIKATDLTSYVYARDNGCSSVTTSGLSHIGRLTINGKTFLAGDQPLTVTLPLGLGAIYVNQEVKTGNTIVRRALFVDLPGTFLDVVVAQSSAGVSCTAPVSIASANPKYREPSKAQVRSVKARLESLGGREF